MRGRQSRLRFTILVRGSGSGSGSANAEGVADVLREALGRLSVAIVVDEQGETPPSPVSRILPRESIAGLQVLVNLDGSSTLITTPHGSAVRRTIGRAESLRREVLQLLLGQPALERLEPGLRVLSGPERLVLSRVILTVGARSTGDLGRTLARSARSLVRDFDRLNFASPRRVMRVAAIARAIVWVRRVGIENDAYVVAGYREQSAYWRAVRSTFGLPHSKLLQIHDDRDAFAGRIVSAARR
jgi:hypothetical protein